jgi:rfaE bifunctional protein kinase chain/domain
MTQPNRIAQLLESVSCISVGVLGDFCLDAYWELDQGMSELSLETGKPTVAVTHQRYSPGGAGNVAHNLIALGVKRVPVFGVAGTDPFGRELQKQLSELGTANGLTLQETAWQTPVYAKPYRGTEEQNRIDFGRFNELSRESERTLIRQLNTELKNLDGLVINQQLPKSIYTPGLVEALHTFARQWPGKVFLVDARHRIRDFQAMICKLNAVEAAHVFGKEIRDNESATDEELRQFAEQIFARTGRPVFITRSRRGILFFDGAAIVHVPAEEVPKPTDPVGAGDTVVAALTAALASGIGLRDSARLASLAASVSIRKLKQTGTATPDEILALSSSAAPIL